MGSHIFIDSTPVLNLDKKFIELADEVVIPTFLDYKLHLDR